ncbi:serine hydrolase domain-containing protein [Kordiimonas pumila]|uniref:Serine hydrolase domain-containing protein n=1 Tax=Kordiimonas pumila TaxID=2161677 RepID=A0ABV7D3M1_9PROT|nr:serine hydrolase domain-containing protein [Kordiimonas pumila]
MMKQLCTTAALAMSFTLTAIAQDEVVTPEVVQEAVAPVAEPYPGLEAFVDGTMEAQFKLLDISAMTVSIVKDGKVIFAKGYGMQDREKDIPVSADKSMFRIGSTSKLFTWTAVMQQVERGNLDLNTDVNKYLKTFQIPATFDEPITLKHVMTHTAGFEDGGMGYLIGYDPAKASTLAEAMAKHIPARVNKPGAYGSYSNYATALAGLIVQNVSGVPFNEYVEKNIYEPLGMDHSSFREPLPGDLLGDMTIGYKREAGVQDPRPYEVLGGFGPAGSMASSATDMAQFMMAHLNGGALNGNRILQPETTKLMHSVLFQPDKRLGGMAHGFYEEYINGHRLIGHGGDTFQFHTNLLIDQDEDLGIFVSYQTITGSKGRNEFIPAFYDHYYPQPLEKVTPPADFNERAGKYAGTYQFWRHNFSTIEKAMALASGGFSVAPSGKNTLIVSGFEEPKQFVEVDENLFRQVDGKLLIAFGEDANGNIQDLYIDGLPFMGLSRAPAFESSLYKMLLPIVSLLLFLTVWTGWFYRRKDYKAMQAPARTAIKLSMATSVLNFGFIFMLVGIMATYQMEIYESIPTILKVALILPILIVLTTLGMVYFAVKAWREGFWRRGRQIHYTLVTLAAVFMVIFYYYWNMIGWQYQ